MPKNIYSRKKQNTHKKIKDIDNKFMKLKNVQKR